MCLSRENQLLSNLHFPSVSKMAYSSERDLCIDRRSSDDFKIDEDILVKKRKLLEDKAPGLFDYLTRLTNEENITETASSPGVDHDIDDTKTFSHTIFIPTPLKNQNSIFGNSNTSTNLSNTVKMNQPKSATETPSPLVSGANVLAQLNNKGNGAQDKAEEEKQRMLMLQLTSKNSMMLSSVAAQTDNLFRLAMKCMEDLKSLKGECNENQKIPLQRMEQMNDIDRANTPHDNNPSTQKLFQHLFPYELYKYELVLDCELPTPIFRERNIIIKAKLVDIMTKQPIINQNKVLVQVSMQTWEIPSNTILRNKTGNKAIMGETEVELKNGELMFDRIQINEVTSKFIHGHVAILITPTKPVNHGTSLTDHEQRDGYINYEHIKPLMLEKIVVKSKKKKPANNKKKSEEITE